MRVLAADPVSGLVFPITVLLAGAVVTGLLVPAINRRREAQRKALEIRTGLVTEISDTVMGFVMSVQFAVLGAAGQSQEAYDQEYRSWETRSAVLGTKLDAYFPGTGLGRDWAAFAERVTAFYALTGVHDRAERERGAAPLLAHYGRAWPDGPSDRAWIAAWGELKAAILEEKGVLIQRVLKTPMRGL